MFYNLKNPHKCLFTSITWNHDHSELIASDEQGRIYFINVHTDKIVQEFQLYQKKILNLTYLEGLNYLFVVTESSIDVLRVKRGLKAGNIMESHTGSIIGIYGLVPFKLTGGHYRDTP